MSFTLAIVGRPNVGKSTLFNRLVGKRLALVDNQPGVTRDLREGAARLGDLRFTVIDTAGLEEATDDSLQGRMRRLTERAVDMADICLFMIDARTGVTPSDQVFAEILRKRSAHVILAANKSEGSAADAGVLEAYALGLGEPIRMSAEHNEGLNDLYSRLMPLADAFAERAAQDAPDTDVDVDADGGEIDEPFRVPTVERPLQVAVVGRPNAGKSTLIRTVSAARPKVADYPFTTLQPNLGVVRTGDERSFVLADIPGLIEGAAEGAGLGHRFLRHLARTNLLLHIVDIAPVDPEADPLREARAIAQELRKYDETLYAKPRWLVLNKVDLIDAGERESRLSEFVVALGHDGPWFAISALGGDGCEALCHAVQAHVDRESARIGAERAAAAADAPAQATPADTEGGTASP